MMKTPPPSDKTISLAAVRAQRAKKDPAGCLDVIEACIPSTEPGLAMELMGFGITSFDPTDIEINEPSVWTVGGATTFFLTPADVARLRQLLAR